MTKTQIASISAIFLLCIGCRAPHHYPKLSSEFLQQRSHCPNLPVIDSIFFFPDVYRVEEGYFFDIEKNNGDLLYEVCLNEEGKPFYVEQVWGQQIIGKYFKTRIFNSSYVNNTSTKKLPARTYVGIRIKDIENENFQHLPHEFSKYIKHSHYRWPSGTLSPTIKSLESMFREKNFSQIAKICHFPIIINKVQTAVNAKEVESIFTQNIAEADFLTISQNFFPIRHGNNYHLTIRSKNRFTTLILSSSCLTYGFKITEISTN